MVKSEFLEKWNEAVQGVQSNNQTSHSATLNGQEIRMDQLSRKTLNIVLRTTSFAPSTFTGNITRDLM